MSYDNRTIEGINDTTDASILGKWLDMYKRELAELYKESVIIKRTITDIRWLNDREQAYVFIRTLRELDGKHERCKRATDNYHKLVTAIIERLETLESEKTDGNL